MPMLDNLLAPLGHISDDERLCFERMCNRPVATKGNFVGSTWMYLSAACHIADVLQRPFILSTMQPIRALKYRCIRPLLESMMSILDHRGRIVLSDEPTLFLIPMRHMFNIVRQHGYVPTVRTWQAPPRTPKIAYCFDGVSAKGRKCPTTEQAAYLLSSMSRLTPNIVKLGLPLTLVDDIEHLCTSSVFVTTSTGISHIAKSTNVPMIVSYFNVGKPSTTSRKNPYDLIDQYRIGWYGTTCHLCDTPESIVRTLLEFVGTI